MRQIDPAYPHIYRYPLLHETQMIPFQLLKVALEEKKPMLDLVDHYQSACFSLFAHHQHKYETSRELDQFFSPVICFLVLSSVRESGGFQLHSVITQIIAHVMFSARATIFKEIKKKSLEDGISLHE